MLTHKLEQKTESDTNEKMLEMELELEAETWCPGHSVLQLQDNKIYEATPHKIAQHKSRRTFSTTATLEWDPMMREDGMEVIEWATQILSGRQNNIIHLMETTREYR